MKKEGEEALQAPELKFPCSVWLMLDKSEGEPPLCDRPHDEAGEECEQFSLEKEGVAEKTCDELNKPQIPHDPVPLVGEEIEKFRSEGGEEGRGGRKVF